MLSLPALFGSYFCGGIGGVLSLFYDDLITFFYGTHTKTEFITLIQRKYVNKQHTISFEKKSIKKK